MWFMSDRFKHLNRALELADDLLGISAEIRMHMRLFKEGEKLARSRLKVLDGGSAIIPSDLPSENDENPLQDLSPSTEDKPDSL